MSLPQTVIFVFFCMAYFFVKPSPLNNPITIPIAFCLAVFPSSRCKISSTGASAQILFCLRIRSVLPQRRGSKNHYRRLPGNVIAGFLEHIELGFHDAEHGGRSLLVFAIEPVRTRSKQSHDEDPVIFQ